MRNKNKIIEIEENPLATLLGTHVSLHERIYSSTEILLVVTSIIFSITAGMLLDKFSVLTTLMKAATMVLITSSALTLIICLFILRPQLKYKKGGTEFYYMDIFSRFTKKEYCEELYSILKSDEKTIKFFVDELYEIGQKVLYPSYEKIKMATEVLIGGIIISAALFLLSVIQIYLF